MWEVEYTDEFGDWWTQLTEAEKIDVAAYVGLLEKKGPQLGYPYSSKIKQSKYSHMRELRIQHKGRPYRVLYTFDPRRTIILLIGGSKGGIKQWYEKYVLIADKLYETYLFELKKEGLIND